MNVTFTSCHVNDLRNLKAKEQALKLALGYVKHWQDDVKANLKPTEESLSYVEATIVTALEE